MNLDDYWSGLTAIGLIASLGAGVVRGFSGFGFSALTVAGISLFMAPATVVPAVLVLEILATISVWRSAVRDLDMAWLKALVIGNAILVPIGVYLLAHLDPLVLRLVVGCALLLTAFSLRWRDGTPLRTGRGVQAATGMLSGFLNGLAASGGVAAALLMAACHVPALAMRGTLIAYVTFASGYTLLWASVFSQGGDSGINVFSAETLRWILVLAPGMLMGMRLGRKAFARSNPDGFRLLVLNLLIVISALSVARSLFDLLKPY
ncbi:MAG: sulfite exporter TauE/SafE family protein [Giesbergeria sp.]